MVETTSKQFSLFKNLLRVFFLFAALYPTLRILLIGAGDSTSLPQFVFSGLNELLLLLVLLSGFGFMIRNADWKKRIQFFDKVLLVYFLFNVILGTFLAYDLRLSVYGFSLTYA